MAHTIHVSFASRDDGIMALETLLFDGISVKEISLILPDEHAEKHADTRAQPHKIRLTVAREQRQATRHASGQHGGEVMAHTDVPLPPELPQFPRRHATQYAGHGGVMAAGTNGYTYDVLGAVIADSAPKVTMSTRRSSVRHAVTDAEEGLGLGLGLGLLTAMCIPGIGMFAGTATVVASVMAGGAAIGSITGGICGWLIDRGITDETAQEMSDYVEAGGATLSITLASAGKEAQVMRVVERFHGRLIARGCEV